MPEELSSVDFMEMWDKWKADNPIIVPERIKTMVDKLRAELDDPNISKEEWLKLVAEDRRHMQGEEDDDIYFQIETHHRANQNGARVMLLEDKLRTCYCGSGLRYVKCHGK